MSSRPKVTQINSAGVIAWALGSVFFFVAFAHRVSPSVMVDELMRDFGVSALVLGNLSAFYFYAYASIQIPVGVMMDRVGPRLLMSLACAICAGGCIVFATSEHIMGAYIGRLLIGLGCGFSWVGVLTIIGERLPPKNFAGFTGGGQFAGTCGAIMGQAPLGLAVVAAGWRNAMLGLAALTAVLGLCIWLFVPSASDQRTRVRQPLMAGLRSAARERQTWLIALVGMSLTGPVLAYAGLWGVPWFKALYGLERSAAAGLLSLVFIGWLVGAPCLGWLSDRLRVRKPLLVFGAALSTVSISCVLYLQSLPLEVLSVLLFLSGVGGSSMILTFATAREHNSLQASGAALGIVNMFVVASGALFQPLIGWLLDQRWDGTIVDGVRLYDADAYNNAMIVLPGFAAVGLVVALTVKEPPRPDTL